MRIEHALAPSSQDIDFLTQKINEETISYGSAYPFAFFIYDDQDQIIAGCNGSVIFGSIYTDQLWVCRQHRKQGLGRKLMDNVHEHGKNIGCIMATTCTMDFQNAEKFYESLGYKVDFERQGYAQNSSCIFLKKQL